MKNLPVMLKILSQLALQLWQCTSRQVKILLVEAQCFTPLWLCIIFHLMARRLNFKCRSIFCSKCYHQLLQFKLILYSLLRLKKHILIFIYFATFVIKLNLRLIQQDWQLWIKLCLCLFVFAIWLFKRKSEYIIYLDANMEKSLAYISRISHQSQEMWQIGLGWWASKKWLHLFKKMQELDKTVVKHWESDDKLIAFSTCTKVHDCCEIRTVRMF